MSLMAKLIWRKPSFYFHVMYNMFHIIILHYCKIICLKIILIHQIFDTNKEDK